MNISRFIPGSVTRAAGKAALNIRSNSPTILFASGVVGVVATTVLASRATLHLEEIVAGAQQTMQDIKDTEAKGLNTYGPEQAQQDRLTVIVQSGIKIGKLYGPTVVVGALSIAALAGSHRILTNRNAALTVAYTGLDKAFKAYRARVRDEVGEDREKALYNDVEDREVLIETEDQGPQPAMMRTATGKGLSPYARIFEKGATADWKYGGRQNQFFIKCQEQMANDILRTRGYIFLNEVYRMLGFEESEAGQIVGWRYDGDGDGYVDFGVLKGNWFDIERFINGDEDNIILDFNVDGPIYNKIGRKF